MKEFILFACFWAAYPIYANSCDSLEVDRLDDLNLELKDVEVVKDLDYSRSNIKTSLTLASAQRERLKERKVENHIRFYGLKRGMNHAVSVWLRKLFLLQGNVEYLNNAHFISGEHEFSGLQYGHPHNKATGDLAQVNGAVSGTAIEFWCPSQPERSFLKRIIRADDLENVNKVDDPQWRAQRLATSMAREYKIRAENNIDKENLSAQIVGFEDFSLSVVNYNTMKGAGVERGVSHKTFDIAAIRDLRSIIASRLKYADGMGSPRHMEVSTQVIESMISIAHIGLTRALRDGRISKVDFDRIFPEGPHPLAEEVMVINADRWAKEEHYRIELAMRLGFTAEQAKNTSTKERSKYGIGKGDSSSSFGKSGEDKQADTERQQYLNDPRMKKIFETHPQLQAIEAFIHLI